MLPKSAKIRPSHRVLYVIQKGQRIPGTLFSLRVLPNRASRSRFAVVVSKKIAKSAVQRNRFRRMVYGAVNELEKSHPSLTATQKDIAIMCAPPIAKSDFHDILASLTKLL